jgi:hypothetical protein
MEDKTTLPPEQDPLADLETDRASLSDQTPRMMGMIALATLAIFLVYGAARLIGLAPIRALVVSAAVGGLMFMATFVLTVLKKESFGWLLALISATTVLTGLCFTISQSAHSGLAIVTGAVVMFIGFLTSLFRNVDDRVRFMPMMISMLVSVMLILTCLG